MKCIENVAQVGPCQSGAGRRGECRFSHAQGSFELIALASNEAEAEQGLGGVWIGLEGTAVGFGGLEKIARGVHPTGFGER